MEENVPYKIFADNYFVGLRLIQELRAKGFEFTGTFRYGRLRPNFATDKEMQNRGRGSIDSRVLPSDNIIAVKCKDNR